MMNRTRVLQYFLALLVGPAFLFVLGCGGDELGTRYPVSGKVTYKGALVEKGKIGFTPEEKEGRGATGQIENGSYSLTTQTPGDGAFPGKYIVTVDTREVDEAAAKQATKEIVEKTKTKVEVLVVPQDVQAKLLKQTKSSTPVKYLSPQSSDKKVTVEARSQTIDIELTD
jgi:hypothetical protein